MQVKTTSVAKGSTTLGLNIHKGKIKIFKRNTENTNAITHDSETLEDVGSFTYLGSIIDERRGSEAGVTSRIGKTRSTFP
ncbi:unnamed protein product [Schistosoma margrebowiei]|uniref:Uncharacterized protein n=1 Tax=Schistosoma margrebowiei TaxID=48269 RepID=A0A183ML26_9TREM|nr:unnamed protein product [Schistosoma margrebowiei]